MLIKKTCCRAIRLEHWLIKKELDGWFKKNHPDKNQSNEFKNLYDKYSAQDFRDAPQPSSNFFGVNKYSQSESEDFSDSESPPIDNSEVSPGGLVANLKDGV